jgi:hypothetical protein
VVNRARRFAVAALFGVIAPAWACSAIIGTKNLTPGAPDDGLTDGARLADGVGPGAVDSSGADAPNDGLGGGGACSGHPCELTPLSSSEDDVEEIQVAGTHVLYRSAASVKTVPLTGGLPSTLVPCADRVGLAVNDRGFYSWCNTALTLRDVDSSTVLSSTIIDGANAAAGGDWLFFREATSQLSRIASGLGDAGVDRVVAATGGYRSFVTTSTELFYMTSLGTLAHMGLGAAVGSGTDLEQDQPTPSPM